MGVCDGVARTRTKTYHSVRNSLVPLDRRGTEESLGRAHRLGASPVLNRTDSSYLKPEERWRATDGPLIPQPDLVTSTEGRAEDRL